MKYKLLAEKGIHFVCLDDGTKIARQVNSIVSQELKEIPIVTLSAIGYSNDKEGLWMDGNRVMHGDIELEGLFDFKYTTEPANSKLSVINFTFSLRAEIVDTVEAPKLIVY